MFSRPAVTQVHLLTASFLLALGSLGPGCGANSDANDGPSSGGSGSDFPTGDGGSNLGGGSNSDGGTLGGNGDDGSGFGRADFRFGINLGHPNPSFDDATMSDLAWAAGVRSIRLKYPEYHFDTWGIDIEVGDAAHYASLGMTDHVAFVIGMTEAHSTAPAASADWERDYYIPKNLYEPIFTDDGSVNSENYYAKYLEQTFSTYKDYVKYWEIFNEPDWVDDWQVTLDWDTTPPDEADLVRFHGSVFDYIRMLRIASAVRDEVAPGTYVLTGGLGYPSFLSAILRYTDNPDGGQVTDAYPSRGGEYFDVLSIHHYPHLVRSGPSDLALGSFETSRDDFLAELQRAGAGEKGFMVTESGAPHEVIDGQSSGPEYARNYLQKAMIWAKAEGFLGIDWFTLSDGDDAADAFSRMGLYAPIGDLTDPSDAVRTTTGDAYLTTSQVLRGARLDIAKTSALALPETARGYVFAKGTSTIYALWATSETSESASTTVSLPLVGSVEVWEWSAMTAPSETQTAMGSFEADLTSSPVFLVVEP